MQTTEGEDAGPPVDNEGLRFAFVLDRNQPGARNHAMRAHWTERRIAKQERRRKQDNSRKSLPYLAAKEDRTGTLKQLESPILLSTLNGTGSFPQGSLTDSQTIDRTTTVVEEDGDEEQPEPGVPPQLLTGVNHALVHCRLDPFDVFPVRLGSQHHKLIHHWLSTHAAMMFEDNPTPEFNPMRDVWFPLDLSNAASFNAIMAHSAAHLAHFYRGNGGMALTRETNSSEALKYKTNAIEILNRWFDDPQKAISNDAFAAVVRLLTFERYWGTEDQWRIHRNGLQRMIAVRGGIQQLHTDWRLELVVSLISLMSEPSWFRSTNNLSEITERPINYTILGPSIDLHKIRCLWLLSFIQDMRNLMNMSSHLYIDGLFTFPALYDAMTFIRINFDLEGQARTGGYLPADYDRLTCLISIALMVQDSLSSTDSAPNDSLATLDRTLAASRYLWETSVATLQSVLKDYFLNFYPNGVLKVDYVTKITEIVSHLSLEAHRGIEKCLLNMFCRTRGGHMPFPGDDEGTPDALLSSVHGY